MKAGIPFPVQVNRIYLEIFGQSLYIWKNWNDTLAIFCCMPLCQTELEWSYVNNICEIFFVLDYTCSTPSLNKNYLQKITV